jgi:hypothetical protein
MCRTPFSRRQFTVVQSKGAALGPFLTIAADHWEKRRENHPEVGIRSSHAIAPTEVNYGD